MEKDEDIKLLLAEEQTLLSRERTMHSYMQTRSHDLCGLVVMKFLSGIFYFCAGGIFIILGALLIVGLEKAISVQESHRQVEGKGGKTWL